jgi:hypothetical protein
MAITRSQQAKQLLALGGRIGLQEGGGIEQRLDQLGGDVSSAEQMLQAINKRLETAESGLGGGIGTLGSNQPFNPGMKYQPQPNQPMAQLPGSRPYLTATIDPNFKPVEELKAADPNNLLPGTTVPTGGTFNGMPLGGNNNGFNFRQEGDMGRYIADNDPGMQFEGYSSYQDYLGAGNKPVSRPQGPQLLSAQGGLGDGIQSRGASGIPAAGYADGGMLVKSKSGSKKPVKQAGATNYLGKQEMVTAPKFWLSEPDHVKAKLAYITDEEEKILIDKNLYGSLKGKPNIGPAGLPSLQGGDSGGLGGDKGTDGGDKGGSNYGQFDRAISRAKNNPTTGPKGDGGGGIKDFLGNLPSVKAAKFGIDLLGKAFSKFGPKSFSDKYGYATDYQGTTGPSSVDNDDDSKGGGDGIVPYWAQLGYPSQAAYLASLQAPAGLPAAVQPQQTMDLNRIAYRLMADGGFLGEEDEPRQAYGLGSIVKKITRPIKKVVKKATSAVKKVTKSPLGRLALAVAAPYALGPAMAQSQFLMGLSAAQRAALISGATTGVTQLASGEDLDLKDIALSAALAGGTAKMFPPGGAKPGVNIDKGRGSFIDSAYRSGGVRGTPNLFDADDVVLASQRATSNPSKFTAFTKDVLNPQTIKNITPEKTGILKTLSDKITGNKLGNLLLGSKDGGISPMKSILLASGLSGLMAKKDFEEDEFSEMDRGEGIDIAAIRRRPFEYMAPRFAGSEFDFYAADGGRIGYQDAGAVLSEKEMKKLAKSALFKGFKKMYSVDPQMAKDNPAYEGKFDMFKKIYDQKFQKGGKAEPVAKKVMPLLDMGGQEMDLRAEGGFVPIGRMEKADDVPARLSKNEFVFTAEAVRNAGEGDVDKGAEVMYNMMKNLEAGGEVSEESQGSDGARKMFQTSQRLEEVL